MKSLYKGLKLAKAKAWININVGLPVTHGTARNNCDIELRW
jgi:hypothetical protein